MIPGISQPAEFCGGIRASRIGKNQDVTGMASACRQDHDQGVPEPLGVLLGQAFDVT